MKFPGPTRRVPRARKEETLSSAQLLGGLQVAVGGSDDANVSPDSTTAADTFKLTLLQYTQEGNLGLGWQFSDFVQEERTAIC